MCLCSGGTPSHYYFPLTVNGVVISVSLYYCIVLLYRLFKTLYPVKWLCCITFMVLISLLWFSSVSYHGLTKVSVASITKVLSGHFPVCPPEAA